MSITSARLSCATRAATSGGSSAAAGSAARRSGVEGGVQNTFGAGAVPATPRTPGVPHAASRPALMAASVSRRNARDLPRFGGTSGWRVGIRAGIRLWGTGVGDDRGYGVYARPAPRVELAGGWRGTQPTPGPVERWRWGSRVFKAGAPSAGAGAR